ncbi:MAG TPA: hypothetical protein VJN02_05890 [Gammaproteobacteria bacterium]|nr:hypothetical protein [Gammaproteobacteria bacterium]
MKINITKKEYRLLLEMLYLADWMMNSQSVERRYKEHEELKKKIFSLYKEMGSEDIIEYSKKLDGYYEVPEYDEYMQEKFITPYDEETFWDELIDRLAVRDIIADLGVEKYRAMEGIERITKVEEVRERYANEFETHGLEHVKIDDKGFVKKLKLSTD